MSMIITQPAQAISLPPPRVAVRIRDATMEDLPFIDALQRAHHKMLGFMPRAQLERKIAAGHVLVAEAWEGEAPAEPVCAAAHQRANGSPGGSPSQALGYVISTDRYFKREDVGIIYQLCVAPHHQRELVGAALVKAAFERSAYGCRLFCCWCAQDIEANRFWESLGFVPLAFRAGSRKKKRIHIFWQKRIRAGDTSTPYWYPSQTGAGLIREDRLVLPIPPGTHWGDAMPMVLPGADEGGRRADGGGQSLQLAHDAASSGSALCRLPSALSPRKKKPARAATITRPSGRPSGGLWFAPQQPPAPAEKPKAKRERPPVSKNDARRIAAARELRDRWLEEVNRDPSLLPPRGKYDASREVPHHHHLPTQRAEVIPVEVRQLPQAA